MKISKLYNAHSIDLPLLNYRVHEKNYSKLHSKMFYQEYKNWFEKNFLKRDKIFIDKINYFRNRLSYLEIMYLLQEEKKNYAVLKKILTHKSIINKIKFLFLFIIPKYYFKFFKK